MWEVAFKMRELWLLPEVSVNFKFNNNMMAYFDLYIRYLEELNQNQGEHSKLNEFYVIPQSEEHENDYVEHIMQSGCKIGECVLRAARVGIVKKN